MGNTIDNTTNTSAYNKLSSLIPDANECDDTFKTYVTYMKNGSQPSNSVGDYPESVPALKRAGGDYSKESKEWQQELENMKNDEKQVNYVYDHVVFVNKENKRYEDDKKKHLEWLEQTGRLNIKVDPNAFIGTSTILQHSSSL